MFSIVSFKSNTTKSLNHSHGVALSLGVPLELIIVKCMLLFTTVGGSNLPLCCLRDAKLTGASVIVLEAPPPDPR